MRNNVATYDVWKFITHLAVVTVGLGSKNVAGNTTKRVADQIRTLINYCYYRDRGRHELDGGWGTQACRRRRLGIRPIHGCTRVRARAMAGSDGIGGRWWPSNHIDRKVLPDFGSVRPARQRLADVPSRAHSAARRPLRGGVVCNRRRRNEKSSKSLPPPLPTCARRTGRTVLHVYSPR